MNDKDRLLLKKLLAVKPVTPDKMLGGNQYEIDITHYNFWLTRAREEAFEASRYERLLREAMPYEDVKGLERYLAAKLKLVHLYVYRADKYFGRAVISKRIPKAEQQKSNQPEPKQAEIPMAKQQPIELRINELQQELVENNLMELMGLSNKFNIS